MNQTAVLKTPSPARVRRESLTDQTVRAIREAILDGSYELGRKLREVELVTRFGVSSSVIREALHVLQGEGIIVTKPYCGRSVFELRREEVSELVMIRASLESYAAYLAAQKITPEMARAIRAAARSFTDAPPTSYGEWVDRELGFHRAVWEASRNEWLLRQLNQFSVPVFAMRLLDRREMSVRSLWENCQLRETRDNPSGHQSLCRAIVTGPPVEARRQMLLHILAQTDKCTADVFQLG